MKVLKHFILKILFLFKITYNKEKKTLATSLVIKKLSFSSNETIRFSAVIKLRFLIFSV